MDTDKNRQIKELLQKTKYRLIHFNHNDTYKIINSKTLVSKKDLSESLFYNNIKEILSRNNINISTEETKNFFIKNNLIEKRYSNRIHSDNISKSMKFYLIKIKEMSSIIDLPNLKDTKKSPIHEIIITENSQTLYSKTRLKVWFTTISFDKNNGERINVFEGYLKSENSKRLSKIRRIRQLECFLKLESIINKEGIL